MHPEYIAGFFDGEGCVPKVSKKHTNQLNIVNTDLKLLQRISTKLEEMGIFNNIHARKKSKPHHSTPYYLSISGAINMYRFYKYIPLRSPKRKRLHELLRSYKNRQFELLQEMFPNGEL